MRVPESSTIAGFNHVSGTVDETKTMRTADVEMVSTDIAPSRSPFKLRRHGARGHDRQAARIEPRGA